MMESFSKSTVAMLIVAVSYLFFISIISANLQWDIYYLAFSFMHLFVCYLCFHAGSKLTLIYGLSNGVATILLTTVVIIKSKVALSSYYGILGLADIIHLLEIVIFVRFTNELYTNRFCFNWSDIVTFFRNHFNIQDHREAL